MFSYFSSMIKSKLFGLITKIAILFVLLSLSFISCDEPTSTIYKYSKIVFSTENNSFAKTDSIRISLENKSDSAFIIGLRCGEYLEMFYQRREKGVWSGDINFWYMTLRCPTIVDSIQSQSIFHYSIEPELFDSSGTYRLLIGNAIVSNSFEIK